MNELNLSIVRVAAKQRKGKLMTTQQISITLDLNMGDQEVLQRILAEPEKIAQTLAPTDPRERCRIIDMLAELATAFSPRLLQNFEGLTGALDRKGKRAAHSEQSDGAIHGPELDS